ncbi:PmoA family protein [uncultured Paludibaculum sp.]|uniref:DUF6807 domain-containing protein n=1 Tax=uncultured Paludibaculum sp. TaxID=1765020 RepID=UPI002AAB9216|nr:PmoA family protein [uncultured Paludibaculum sp.]
MRSSLLLAFTAATWLSAQVRFAPDAISVTVDGKPFTTFHYGDNDGKPFLAPIYSASGKIVTRGFPMWMLPGESRDHLHHRGLWFTYDDVNGVKFWENDPTYTKGRIGRVVVRDAKWKDGATKAPGTLSAVMEWRDPEGKVLLVENRDMTFLSDPTLRIIDFNITLTAATDVTFGDTKEGAFAIRLRENFTERKGGKMTNSNGQTGMVNVWGKRAAWVDYTAEVDGERLGVAIFDHPKNPNAPTYWHARDYGLFALDPFGQNAFDPNAEERKTKLAKGQKIQFRWRVVIHPGDAETGHVADLFKQFAAR